MELKMVFDEVGVLTENLAFMAATLGVPEVVVVTTSEADTSKPEEKVAAEKAGPGKPTYLITFEQPPQ
jgi:hypothetical protein